MLKELVPQASAGGLCSAIQQGAGYDRDATDRRPAAALGLVYVAHAGTAADIEWPSNRCGAAGARHLS